MNDMIGSVSLWAMRPTELQAMMAKRAPLATVPEMLGQLFGKVAAGQSGKQANPVRQEGAALIVPVTGVLAPAGMYSGGTAYEQIADSVRRGAADAKVSRIVLAIRSPGGTVWGCEETADAIYAARRSKPVIAVAEPYCFSAAYWLATQASQFFVTKSGEVGSVGVRSGHTDMSGFENKIGIKTTLIASHDDKIAAHPYAPLSVEDRREIQSGVDAANRRFAKSIARGRGMRIADVAAVHGTGKTFTAQQALAVGAVDGIATLAEVVGRRGSGKGNLDLRRRQAEIVAAMIRL